MLEKPLHLQDLAWDFSCDADSMHANANKHYVHTHDIDKNLDGMEAGGMEDSTILVIGFEHTIQWFNIQGSHSLIKSRIHVNDHDLRH